MTINDTTKTVLRISGAVISVASFAYAGMTVCQLVAMENLRKTIDPVYEDVIRALDRYLCCNSAYDHDLQLAEDRDADNKMSSELGISAEVYLARCEAYANIDQFLYALFNEYTNCYHVSDKMLERLTKYTRNTMMSIKDLKAFQHKIKNIANAFQNANERIYTADPCVMWEYIETHT